MKTRHLSLVALALLLGWAAAANAQSTHFTLGLGYQWVDLKGNQDMYRSQVNEDDGLVLDALTVSHTNADGYAMRVDAAGFGGSPQGHLRLESALGRIYRLRLGYSRADHFSALPVLANPFLGQGVVPGQHITDRRVENLDLDVEFFPGRAVTPLIGYTRTRRTGSASTTVFAGQDEFRLDSDLSETVQEFRAGLGFSAGGFAGSIVQGWRDYDSTEDFTLAAGAEGGNNARPVLGRDVTATAYTRTSHAEGNTPFTSARVAGRLGERARIVGSYSQADLSTESRDEDSLAGSLVSFDIARFFTGRDETAVGTTDGKDWRGEARLETEVIDGVDFSVGYSTRHRELDGTELISTLYRNTTNFVGADPRDIAVLIDAANALERDERALEGTVSLSGIGPAKLWVSWTQAHQNLTLTPDAAQVVVSGGQGGSFARRTRRAAAGLDLDLGDLGITLDVKREDANDAVMRSDFLERERWRLRGRWDLGKVVHIVATAEKLDASNPTPGVGYDEETRRWGVAVNVDASKALTVRGSYDLFRTDSRIVVRIPVDFTLDESIYSEDGEAFDGGLTLHAGRFSLDAGYTQYKNGGPFAFALNRAYARCDLDFTEKVGAGVLFDARDFNQPSMALADYEATRYALVLRWHQ